MSETALDQELLVEEWYRRFSCKAWRMSNLYYIRDEKGVRIKFSPNEVQKQLAASTHPLSIILKSRQHGVTTYYCIKYLDDCLFNRDLNAGIIAHNREDSEDFFTKKIRYAYDNIDEEWRIMVPEATQDSSKALSFDNGSNIRVGTSLRSGTNQRLHISEFGKICAKFPDKAQEIVTGAFNTVHVGSELTVESTAEGNHGYFFDYSEKAKELQKLGTKLTPLDFKFFFFAWWQDTRNVLDVDIALDSEIWEYFENLKHEHNIHLNKNQKVWYAKKAETQGEDMKREHPSTPEEAFEASIRGAIFGKQFDAIYKERRIGDFPHNPDFPVSTYWDIGIGDMNAIWFVQDINNMHYVIDYYENNNAGFGHYAEVLKAKPYRYDRHVGPHDFNVREYMAGGGQGKTRRAIALAEYGIRFDIANKLLKGDQIEAARRVLPKCLFNEQTTVRGVKCLKNYRYEWDDKLACFRDKPLHDWASNGSDAFEVFAVMNDTSNLLYPDF